MLSILSSFLDHGSFLFPTFIRSGGYFNGRMLRGARRAKCQMLNGLPLRTLVVGIDDKVDGGKALEWGNSHGE